MIGLLLWLAGTERTPRSEVSPPLPGISAFTPVLDLPYLRRGVQTHQFTSYDRAGDNYDADYFPLYKESDGACVLFDVYGPGCLYRLHANLWNGDLTGINIRFTFDDEATPRIDMDVTKFFSPENPLRIFKEPYAHVGQGWRFVYHPFFFRRHLKVSLSKEPFGDSYVWDNLPWMGRYDQHPVRRNHWYNFTYHTYAGANEIQSWTKPADMRPVAAFLDPARSGEPPAPVPGATAHEGELDLAPGTSRVAFQKPGSGVITALRFELDPADLAAAFDCNLRIVFDGAREPEVEAPLGCFFGVYRQRPDRWIVSRYVGVQGAKLYSYFPMPYWRGVRVSIENSGRLPHRLKWTVESGSVRYPEADCGTFHAVYHRATPRVEGHDYRYVDFRGEGHVVGHFTYRFDTSMEEDERTYFDDIASPAIYGEGFEDDHNQGWGLRDASEAIYGSTGSDGGAGAVWRFFVPDLYVFHRAVRHGHQVYGPNSPRGHEGMYKVGSEESVAFLYAKDRVGLTPGDTIRVGDPQSERKHGYRALGNRKDVTGSWWYDGEFNNVLFPTPPTTRTGASTSMGCEFRLKVDPNNRGIRLVRTTDKEDNRQLASVFVDGQRVEERKWFTVDFDRTFRGIRWLDSSFEIPARYTQSKRWIQVRIELESSKTGRWDDYGYTAYEYR